MLDQSYLREYYFDWKAFDVLLEGGSALDQDFYSRSFKTNNSIEHFMQGYGYNLGDPIQRAELFGNYQEAVEFVRRYFLKEGNSEGHDFQIPVTIQQITGIEDVFKMAAGSGSKEEMLWAAVFLKVMHTILHADKDLRYQYFSLIQTQIFDRFYRFMDRDQNDELFLMSNVSDEKIPIVDFQTKSKKSRDSIIIKMLHKKENVAEELFDRIGIRFVTKNKFDVIRVISFLLEHNVFILHNIKPSRSQNSVVDLKQFREDYFKLLKKALRDSMDHDDFYERAVKLAEDDEIPYQKSSRNEHSSKRYRAVHFTGRQLIHYQNPLASQISEIKRLAKKMKVEDGTDELNSKIASLDMSHITRELRFFYPFEVQVTDMESHEMNTKGEASHRAYKKSQVKSAMERLMKPLSEFYQAQN